MKTIFVITLADKKLYKLSLNYLIFITTLIIMVGSLATPAYAAGAPTIISTLPASAQTQADPESALYIRFDRAMDPATLIPANITVQDKESLQAVSLLSIHYEAGNPAEPMAVLIPAVPLKLATEYQVTVNTEVRDSENNHLAQNYIWSFKTATAQQDLAPAVIMTTPLPGGSLVGLTTHIQVNFNHNMNPGTLNNTSFVLKDSTGNQVTVKSMIYDDLTRSVSLVPVSLKSDETYQVTITQAVTDDQGSALAQDYTWSFTTGSTPYYNPHGNYVTNSSACKSCHQTHTAEGKGLLNKSTQTQVCYTCHDGSGSSTNLKDLMSQTGTTQSYHSIMDTGNPKVASKLECTDCHNPHGDKDSQGHYYPNLLRATNGTTTAYQGVDFCIVCHNADDSMGWNKSAYKTSIHYNEGMDCSNCHASHSSPNPRLETDKEDTPTSNNQCLKCHGGNPPTNYQSAKNVKDDFQQTYRHPTLDISGVHKDSETSADLMSDRHAECVDCHDPHTLKQSNITVLPSNNLCFKCHSSSEYGAPTQSDNTTSGFSNASQANLHNFSGSTGGHQGVSCSSCHVSVSHGYFRKGMVGALADNDPLADSSQILAIDSGAATNNWEYSSCTTNCHTAGGA